MKIFFISFLTVRMLVGWETFHISHFSKCLNVSSKNTYKICVSSIGITLIYTFTVMSGIYMWALYHSSPSKLHLCYIFYYCSVASTVMNWYICELAVCWKTSLKVGCSAYHLLWCWFLAQLILRLWRWEVSYTFLWNICWLSTDYMALYPKR
jgi:hypothetical protein